MAERITEAELAARGIDSRMLDVHTSMPGRVQRYDATRQVADVVPQFLRAVPDGEGAFVLEQLPVLLNVRVCFHRAGGFFISFPIAAGDYVRLHFAERALGTWLQKGEPCDPVDLRTHSLAGAFAVPGLYPSAKALVSADATNMVIGLDGGVQIQITPGGQVLLGGSFATDFVAMAAKVVTQLNALKAAIAATTIVSADGGASFKTTLLAALAAWPTSVASGGVKALP